MPEEHSPEKENETIEHQPESVKNLSPEEKRDFETRQEKLERQINRVKRESVDSLDTQGHEEVEVIKQEAQKSSGMASVASTEGTAERLLETVVKGDKKLEYVLRAAQEINPRSFDRFIDLLRNPDILQELEKRGEIQ
jgi:hydroxymethylpyrimidine pyrophosphatase-like HAD family hydrolase